METIYLSLRTQVAVGTFFMKSPVADSLMFLPDLTEHQNYIIFE